MEYTTTEDRVLKFACTNEEISCIIGNLFTELTPPCRQCKTDKTSNIAISGITYAGEAATLTIVKDGFLFDGSPETIQYIRQRRCIYNE